MPCFNARSRIYAPRLIPPNAIANAAINLIEDRPNEITDPYRRERHARKGEGLARKTQTEADGKLFIPQPPVALVGIQ